MTAANAPLAELSGPERQERDAWLADFDQTWDERRLAGRVRELPPVGNPLRLPLLSGMVAIDLRRHWLRGQRASLETYLRLYPELGTRDTVPVALLFAEYAARLQAGAPVAFFEFSQRFPRQADALKQLIEQGDPAISAALPSTRNQETPPPQQSTPSEGAARAQGTDLPENFGRYRILQKVGQGGMGAVYLAHDTQLDRKVALKVPHFTPAEDATVLERFHREARAAATLIHPNICPIYDAGEIGRIHYLTMGFIEGQTLSQVLRRGPLLPAPQAAAIVRSLAQALAEAHARGIIHRDLKPSNVMIDQRGEPVIMDFGLARRSDKEEVRITQNGSVLGTPEYMAPEQAEADPSLLGPSCDIYSLGVMLYELLTNRLPFEGPMAAQYVQKLTKAPPPPRTHRPDLDPRLNAICLRALAKNPKDRFASMSELAAALTSYLQAPNLPAGPPAGGPAKPPPPAPVKPPAPGPMRPPPPGPVRPAPPGPVVLPAGEKKPLPPLPPAPPGAKAPPSKPPAPPIPRARREWLRRRGLVVAAAAALVLLLTGIVIYVATNQGTTALEGKPGEGGAKVQSGTPAKLPTALDFCVRGESAATDENWDKALADFKQALVLEPKLVRALIGRGRAELKKDSVEMAFADFDDAIRQNPMSLDALCGRGEAFRRKGERAKAKEDYTRALSLNPNHGPAYAGRAAVYAEEKDYDKALQDYDKAIDLDGKDAARRRARADVYDQKGDYEQAIKDYQAALRLGFKTGADAVGTRLGKAYLRRGAAYAQKGDYDRAIADYQEAKVADPRLADATYEDRLAEIHYDRGLRSYNDNDYERAITDLGEAVGLRAKRADPNKLKLAKTYNLLGNAFDAKADYDQAIKQYDLALKWEPQDAVVWRNRGNTHYKADNFDQAILDLEQALRFDPKNADYFNLRSMVYEGKKLYAKAVEDCDKAIEVALKDPAFKLRAHEYYKQRADLHNGGYKKDYEKALADLTKALELKPDYAIAYLTRGRIYFDRNIPDKALKDLTDAINSRKDYALAYYYRGKVHAELKDYDKAIKDYSEAIRVWEGAKPPSNTKDLAQTYWQRGLAKDKSGDKAGAKADKVKAGDLDSTVGSN